MNPPRRYFKELRFRQLRALVMLARKGTFSAVAEVFGIAVPSVCPAPSVLPQPRR